MFYDKGKERENRLNRVKLAGQTKSSHVKKQNKIRTLCK